MTIALGAAIVAVLIGAAWGGKKEKDALPRGASFAVVDAPAMRWALHSYRYGNRGALEKARALLSRMKSQYGALAGQGCTRAADAAAAIDADNELLDRLSNGGYPDEEMMRFAILRKAVAHHNRFYNPSCGVADWRRLERILPGAGKASLDEANLFYVEWRDSLQARLGGNYPRLRDAAIANVGTDNPGGDEAFL